MWFLRIPGLAHRGCRGVVAVALAAWVAFGLAACGGGTTTVTTVRGLSEAVLDEPSGPNTTEVVVDEGPVEAFGLGVANIPYVTVTVCQSGSTTACATIDHVLVDTGSIGLRLLKSALGGLDLPAVQAPADTATGRAAAPAAECYPFVLGAIWGPVVRGDVVLGGQTAPGIPVQLLDDSDRPNPAAPTACVDAADGGLIRNVTTLQAKGILGIGMLGYDCGLACADPAALAQDSLYYACSDTGCVPAAMPAELQLQNPIIHFAENNNGSILVLPSVPEVGALRARGRLVFGIGTQANNQLPAQPHLLFVDADPASPGYLYVRTDVDTRAYPNSYLDSGSNGLFFDDAALTRCGGGTGLDALWYCPAQPQARTASITDATGAVATVPFVIGNADLLFSVSSVAFANLGGAVAQSSGAFVWGLPFFYGRSVYTSIWGQALSGQGPWWAF